MADDRITPFAKFFQNWEHHNKMFLQKLLVCGQNHDEQDSLVREVLSHYEDYYDAKSKAAEYDVFVMFSPPWFSSYERTLLWVGGFKPSVAFLLVEKSVGDDLSVEQAERIAVVRKEVRRAEWEISLALAGVQEGVAAPMTEVEELKAAMLAVIRDADGLRQRTGMQVVEVLNVGQKVKFLTVTSQFWVECRRLGMERDGCFDDKGKF